MRSKNNGKDFCMFAFPGMFCFFAVVIVPFIYGIYLTLTDWNGVSKEKNFIGLRNFAGVVKDGQFWTSLLLTFKYVILVVVLVNVLAFVIAYLLTRGIKGQNFFRAGFFTPNLIGGIVLGYIWQFVFSRVFVNIGESTGWNLFEASWLSDPAKAFAALVLVSVWQLSGYMILIYVAGFMGLSEDVMEAASIDGASGWVKLKSIIMPLMMSSVTICLFLTLSRAFMVYDVNLSLTAGAPYGTTEMAAMHVYEKAFTSRQFGVGQAEALILFIIVAGISCLQVYLVERHIVVSINNKLKSPCPSR
ncbi:MAG: sugar ABC transporter permease [Dorea sp.]|jgi:raffinose/stachyose/melibiose transport system permease protein|nr:sugar ABC transporter permease [Dorea sp.]